MEIEDRRAKLVWEGRKYVCERERERKESAILPKNTDIFERGFLSIVALPQVTLSMSAVTKVLRARIFPDCKE